MHWRARPRQKPSAWQGNYRRRKRSRPNIVDHVTDGGAHSRCRCCLPCTIGRRPDHFGESGVLRTVKRNGLAQDVSGRTMFELGQSPYLFEQSRPDQIVRQVTVRSLGFNLALQASGISDNKDLTGRQWARHCLCAPPWVWFTVVVGSGEQSALHDTSPGSYLRSRHAGRHGHRIEPASQRLIHSTSAATLNSDRTVESRMACEVVAAFRP